MKLVEYIKGKDQSRAITIRIPAELYEDSVKQFQIDKEMKKITGWSAIMHAGLRQYLKESKDPSVYKLLEKDLKGVKRAAKRRKFPKSNPQP